MKKLSIILLCSIIILGSCKKIIRIDPPSNSITTSQVFTSEMQARAAAAAIYSDMVNYSGFGYSNGGMTLFAGMSADELTPFYVNPEDEYGQFYTNSVSPDNGQLYMNFWSKIYATIYKANAIIEGLNSYAGIRDSVKNELTGEAKFIRGFCYFYLLNLFGNIPLVLTTNYTETSYLQQSSSANVFEQIVEDLNDAKARLPDDFTEGKGERIIPNRGAATALLARVYLYKEDFINAIEQSSELIDQPDIYTLVNVNEVFLKNNAEAIWQLQQDNTALNPGFNSTYEGFRFIPFSMSDNPLAIIPESIVQTFTVTDNRLHWIDSGMYNGVKYYFPYKYKSGPAQSAPYEYITEYYMVLRLAEQYLIRAEARAQLNNLPEAISDLNIIRHRAGLSEYSGPNDNKDSVMAAIMHERQIEFFAEWGHRWLDLKRWGKADLILAPIKGTNWQTTDQLYPIPRLELQTDPNLIQNNGY